MKPTMTMEILRSGSCAGYDSRRMRMSVRSCPGRRSSITRCPGPRITQRLTRFDSRLLTQSGNTLTRMFWKHALLTWPGIGGCPCKAKVPRPSIFGPGIEFTGR